MEYPMAHIVPIILALSLAVPAAAQRRDMPTDQEDPQAMQQLQPQSATVRPENVNGRIANSSVGEVGQRQTRADMAPATEPMARITSRINNRVQNRIRNRIDRNYDPQANATSPFKVAEDQTRVRSRR